ncbi:MAG TPA: hypothetical protein VF075_07000 [Pyrinomonadaceae bacterium]
MALFCSEFFPPGRKGATLFTIAFLLVTASSAFAQSIDPNAPAPVRGNTVNGRIAARDLGDARVTDHYFALTGTPGDLMITVQSTNLNGDIDVFTAASLRPLLKVTVYAELSTPVTKSIYLRKRENLVLRIEARSPNDDEGTYRLFFGGSFEPIIGGPEMAEGETPSIDTPARTPGTKRVSSVGARIEEPSTPPTEVAAAPTPEPAPAATPAETPEAKPPKAAANKIPEYKRPPPPRRSGTRRSAPVRPAPRTTDTATATPKEEPKPQPPAEPEPELGPRLVIETNDGTLINRSMSTVRRVTVENGQVVVIGRDGKIDRILLANIVRMSISP